MSTRSRLVAALLAGCAYLGPLTRESAAGAPPQDPAAGTPAPQAAPAETERVDLVDLVRRLRGKPPTPDHENDLPERRVILVPIIASKPSTGFRVGLGANIEFGLGSRATRLSSINTALSISTRKQVSANFQPLIYGRDDAWLLLGENQFSAPSLNDTPLGVLAGQEGPEVEYHLIRFSDTYARRIRGHLYAGAGLVYRRQSDFEPTSSADSAFLAYSAKHGFDTGAQTAAGPSISLIFDDRDYPNDATRGMLVDTSYRMYIKDFLGGDSTWQRLLIDVRRYRKLTTNGRHRAAVWGFADLVTSGTAPYFSLPTMGGDLRGRSGRGYAEGQLRGDRLVSFEAEYRAMLMANGLVGLAVFANTATVGDQASSTHIFDHWYPGGGIGVRFQLQKRSRTNFTIDFGFGRNGSHAFYVGLMDTF